MIDELLLLSGNDIPFVEGQLTIHQPTIKELAYITESRFWLGCELLRFNKNSLLEQDKVNLQNSSNFNIIMMMVQEKNLESRIARINMMSLLALLFPLYQIQLTKQSIVFKHSETQEIAEINERNFQQFKEILTEMFCLKGSEGEQYNPSGQLAKKIAEKLKQGRAKKAAMAPPQTKISLLSRYVSILAVGERKDINDLMNYTIYQLMDEFSRFELKMNYDSWEKYRIAGATGMKDPEDWFKDIHSGDDDKRQTI